MSDLLDEINTTSSDAASFSEGIPDCVILPDWVLPEKRVPTQDGLFAVTFRDDNGTRVSGFAVWKVGNRGWIDAQQNSMKVSRQVIAWHEIPALTKQRETVRDWAWCAVSEDHPKPHNWGGPYLCIGQQEQRQMFLCSKEWEEWKKVSFWLQDFFPYDPHDGSIGRSIGKLSLEVSRFQGIGLEFESTEFGRSLVEELRYAWFLSDGCRFDDPETIILPPSKFLPGGMIVPMNAIRTVQEDAYYWIDFRNAEPFRGAVVCLQGIRNGERIRTFATYDGKRFVDNYNVVLNPSDFESLLWKDWDQ